MITSDCCGAEMTGEQADYGICPDCREHCEVLEDDEEEEQKDTSINPLPSASFPPAMSSIMALDVGDRGLVYVNVYGLDTFQKIPIPQERYETGRGVVLAKTAYAGTTTIIFQYWEP